MSEMIGRRYFVAGAAGAGALAALGLSSAAQAAAEGTDGTSYAAQTPASTAAAATSPTLKVGSSGAAVKDLQTKLSAAGFWLGTADGAFGALTQQAVYAVQKANGLVRDGIVGPMTWAAVRSGRRPLVRSGADGIEIDKARQLLMLVRGGRAQVTLNTSTGSGETFTYNGKPARAVTPSGNFKFWWAYPGTGWQNGSLGEMWRPVYFNGNIAIHGSLVIPPYAASHGCARLTVAAQDMLLAGGYERVGTAVRVY